MLSERQTNNTLEKLANMNTQLSKTYLEAEKKLTSNNFKFELGTPINGVRFKSNTHYAVVLRSPICEFNYQTYFYVITN